MAAGVGRYAAAVKGSRIPRERWPEVIARAEEGGLRATAREFGVSHETIRAILREGCSLHWLRFRVHDRR
jgi:hypothetical protein